MTSDLATESCRLVTTDGLSLEAELRVPAELVGAVVLAHPHPQHGGSMRSLVTSELFRTLPERGIAALRFNFRGVEGSEGTYGGGRDERHDIAAGIDALTSRLSDRPADHAVPLILCGWSFGADVALSVLDERLAGWFLIASPLRILPLDEFVASADPRPKCFAIPEHDEYCQPEAARHLTEDWTNVTMHTIVGADHFLVGRTDKLADLLADFVLATNHADHSGTGVTGDDRID